MTHALKPAVKEAWVAALRSGDYKQTKYELQDKDGFCCLGVLCDVYAKQNPNGQWCAPEARGDREFTNGDETTGNVLPKFVVAWAFQDPTTQLGGGGMLPNRVDVGDGVEFTALYELNDTANYDFEQIADVIVEQL
jgi:hypothetical protein